ncbi:hypothetical protein EDD21DRAFT_449369 [Dissophora ornata]|nr:hypothetical protein EDD21DRAFT_449369 [Dissophora ornata]
MGRISNSDLTPTFFFYAVVVQPYPALIFIELYMYIPLLPLERLLGATRRFQRNM